MRSFFDTNILVYLFDNNAPAKKERAQTLLVAETEAGRTVFSTQVLQEFFVTVTRKLSVPLSMEDAESVIRHLSTFPIVSVEAPHIMSAIARIRLTGYSFWDSLIIETAISAGAATLYTEDLQHDQVIEDLRICNPFV